MIGRKPWSGAPSLGGFGGPAPRDVLVLLGVLFATFTLQFFVSTAALPALMRLSPAVWQSGQVWRLFTYPFAGQGGPSIWFLLELLILYFFAREVYRRVGRRRFWSLLAWGTVAAGLVAVATELIAMWIPGAAPGVPFTLMQGQRTLIVITIAAFATLFGHATIYLFFILPIQARWFLWIEILFAFMGFLGTRDLAGFLGICTAVAVTNRTLASQRLARSMRELWLRLEQRRIRWKLDRMRRRRGMRLVKGQGGRGNGGDGGAPGGEGERRRREPWVH
jgi:membrane associated rhomboid family serine protease